MESFAAKLAALSLGSLCVMAAATAQRAGNSISIQNGIVVEAKGVEMSGAGGTGALVGGLIGYATSSGNRSSRRVRDGLLGSALGGGVASSTRGPRQGMQYRVNTGNGEIVVVSDQTEIGIGDCVTVENAGTGAANIRRASMALCEQPGEVDEAIAAELQDDAENCLAAKGEMLGAETDDALEQAVRRARILCNS